MLPGPHILAQLVTDELADVDLSLLRAAPDMRGQDHVGETLQAGHEFLPRPGRLLEEHVHRGAGQMSGQDALADGPVINHEAAAQIEEEGSLTHAGQFGLTEHAAVVRPPVDMKTDHIRPAQQLL